MNAESPHFLQPSEVVERALDRCQADGTVRIYDEVEDEWYERSPRPPIVTNELPPDRYAEHLIALARAIAGTIDGIGIRPEHDPLTTETQLRLLASSLTRYLSDPAFIEAAADLIRVEGTKMLLPNLPTRSPWRWVPTRRL